MPSLGFYGGHQDAKALAAANNGSFTIVGGGEVRLQAAFFTTPSAAWHFRILQATSGTATTLATAEGFLTHGGSIEITLPPSGTWYFYWYTTNAAGAALVVAATDYIDVLIHRR